MGAQHQQIEAFGLLVSVHKLGWQASDVADQFSLVVARQRFPGFGPGELFYSAPLRPHHEVLDIHGGHHLVQMAGRAVAQL